IEVLASQFLDQRLHHDPFGDEVRAFAMHPVEQVAPGSVDGRDTSQVDLAGLFRGSTGPNPLDLSGPSAYERALEREPPGVGFVLLRDSQHLRVSISLPDRRQAAGQSVCAT
ncbi:MAG TPA: hypothetical protein VJZ25_01180, partial [Gemmatimonadaceae bacterium]|nr:hypothetical protein [Gemmatimonadaceae bacterium]